MENLFIKIVCSIACGLWFVVLVFIFPLSFFFYDINAAYPKISFFSSWFCGSVITFIGQTWEERGDYP